MEHKVSYQKFINYFTAMSQLERFGDLTDLLSSMEIDSEEEKITFNNQKMFDIFGHLESVHELYMSIQVAPDERVLDGSEPIEIKSEQISFGHYDDEVSPVVEKILKKGKELANFYWQLKFTFKQVREDSYVCITTGNKTNVEGEALGSTSFSGTTFAPTIKMCLDNVYVLLPSILGVNNA